MWLLRWEAESLPQSGSCAFPVVPPAQPAYELSLPHAGGNLGFLSLVPDRSPTMQWLMRLRALRGIRKSFRGFQAAPWHLHCRPVTGVGVPKWNDFDRPEEFNFASDVLDYWAQMEQVRGHHQYEGRFLLLLLGTGAAKGSFCLSSRTREMFSFGKFSYSQGSIN